MLACKLSFLCSSRALCSYAVWDTAEGMSLPKLLWLPMSIKVIKSVLYRHRETLSREFLCEDPPPGHFSCTAWRFKWKNMNCSQWPPHLPTLEIVRLMTRGFSFSFYLASKLTSCSVSCLTSQILLTLYLTLFSLSHQLIPGMSLLCPQLMLSRHRLLFHSRLLCLQVDPFFCFLCQILF